MLAMVVEAPRRPLAARELPLPEVGPDDVLVRVAACGVCRTDLHVVDGELPPPERRSSPATRSSGEVVRRGARVARFAPGDRVGMPWLGWTCGACALVHAPAARTCARARASPGGTATAATRSTRSPTRGSRSRCRDGYADARRRAAALRRAHRLPRAADGGRRATARHLRVRRRRAPRRAGRARRRASEVFAFTRPGDEAGQRVRARGWAPRGRGRRTTLPPAPLDAAILFAPVGALVPAALRAVAPGGTVVCAGIHMSDIPSFPYELLWGERTCARSRTSRGRTATRSSRSPRGSRSCRHVTRFALRDANAALDALRAGRIRARRCW